MKSKFRRPRTCAISAVLMAVIVVVSMVAIGGIATLATVGMGDGVVAADSGFPSGSDDLASDEYLVDDDYEPGEVADDDQLYPNIQSAIDNASAGYTVYVREGSYSERVLVDKRLDLIGEGASSVEVTGNSVALNVTGDDVTVDGFTFVGDSGDNVVEVVGASSSNDVKNLEFTDNRVEVAEDGVGLYHAPMNQDPSHHDETLIQDNVFTVQEGSVSSPVTAQSHILIDGDSSDIPHHITISDNEFTSPTDDGGENLGQIFRSVILQADDSQVAENVFDARADTDAFESAQVWVGSQGDNVLTEGNLVTDNIIEANRADYGIVANYEGGQDVTVSGNSVSDAERYGIIVVRYDGVVVENNDVDNSGGTGIYVAFGEDFTVSSNDVHNDENVGIFLKDIRGAQVDNNDATNAGSTGIWVFDSTGVDVQHNDLTDNGVGAKVDGQGQTFGPESASGVSSDVTFENNEFVDNADVGLHVADFDDSVAPDDYPQANYNDFSAQDHDVRNDVSERIDARLNWFGVHDHTISDEASVAGDVLYDPFLTATPGAVDQNPDETEKFAHDFTLDASEGSTHVIASPGPGDRTVGDTFADLPMGTELWAYDNANSQWIQPASGASIKDLDAFVVTNLTEDATVAFGFAGDGQGHTSNADLSEGWNLVASPRKDSVDPAFDQSAATITSIMHLYEDAESMPAFMNMVDAAGDDSAWQATHGHDDDRCVSPYTGYWIYVDDDSGGLPSNLVDGVSYNDAIDLLRTDDDSYPCGSSSGT